MSVCMLWREGFYCKCQIGYKTSFVFRAHGDLSPHRGGLVDRGLMENQGSSVSE